MEIRFLLSRHLKLSEQEQGSTLTEFTIVAPLLLLFIAGLLAMGLLLVNVSFMSQTSFLSAMSVAETPTSSAPAAIQAEADRLHGFEHFKQISNSTMEIDATYAPGSQTGKPILSVSMHADVNPIFGSQFVTETTMFAAFGVLLPDPSIFTSLNDFENPASNPCVKNCPVVDVDDTKPIKTVDDGGVLSPADLAQAKLNLLAYMTLNPSYIYDNQTNSEYGYGSDVKDGLTGQSWVVNCTPDCAEVGKVDVVEKEAEEIDAEPAVPKK